MRKHLSLPAALMRRRTFRGTIHRKVVDLAELEDRARLRAEDRSHLASLAMSSWALLPFVLYFLAESGSGGSASLFQKESKASGPLTISIVNNYNFLSGNDAKRVAAIADKPVASLNDVPGNSQNPSSANPDKSIGHVDGACPLGWSYFEGTRKCFKVSAIRRGCRTNLLMQGRGNMTAGRTFVSVKR